MSKIADIGVNLFDKQIANDTDIIIQDAKKNDVDILINICNSIREVEKVSNILEKYKNVYTTIGNHPHSASRFMEKKDENLTILSNFLMNKKAVAVGECGLDYNRMFSLKSDQLQCFELQIELSKKCGKPLYLHERDAFDDMYSILKNNHIGRNAVIHCFTGNKEHLKKYLELGCYIGITGWITDFSRGQYLREAIEYLPLDRLMIETDSPYLYPKNTAHTGKFPSNTPKNVSYVAKEIATLKNINEETVRIVSYENTKRFFEI